MKGSEYAVYVARLEAEQRLIPCFAHPVHQVEAAAAGAE